MCIRDSAVVYQSLMFIINNLSILFCVGIAGAMAKKNKGHASLIALMSFFLFLQANNIVLNATGSLADASGMLGLTGTEMCIRDRPTSPAMSP